MWEVEVDMLVLAGEFERQEAILSGCSRRSERDVQEDGADNATVSYCMGYAMMESAELLMCWNCGRRGSTALPRIARPLDLGNNSHLLSRPMRNGKTDESESDRWGVV